MKSVLLRYILCGLATMALCFSASSVKAQSGSRGVYAPPAMSASPSPSTYAAPAYSTPNVAAPAYSSGGGFGGSYGTYQPSVSSAPIATGSGCSGPGCSSASIAQPSTAMNVYSQYPVYQSQPTYSARNGQHPANMAGPTYYSGYSQPVAGQQYMRRTFNHCGN